MIWSHTIDIQTFHDSFQTYKTHFKKKYRPRLSSNDFFQLTLAANYKYLTIKQLKKLNAINLNYDRLTKNINNTYINKNDILSIKYSMKNIVSPICILYINKSFILLDGMHRIVASYLSKSKVLVCFVDSRHLNKLT